MTYLPLGEGRLKLLPWKSVCQEVYSCSAHQREACVRLPPARSQPNMLRILCHHHGSRTSGQKIEIVDVVTRSSHHGMVPVPYQNCVAIVDLEYRAPRTVGAIKVLEGK